MAQKIINVSAGIIIKDDQVLICQRREAHHKGAWEFPGGKIELNESHQEALKRELNEELSINCEIGQHFHSVFYKLNISTQLNLHAYLIKSFIGTPKCLVHSKILWITLQELSYYNFLPADLPLVENLLNRHKKEPVKTGSKR
ncbi:hypothetical protein LNTAR_04686 [Lentisphaera araneosa HTCC2155]|jgi:8-oxo-dGTP diphosphatase|uniref:8-oxo-dGTP diphosphatase n=1 Tax=Lentisphaera araneosa HTCC2155 TaxID=313628 RepID=A6DQN6_9BACT|nr:(deoxy)nucleoside triphosphate pyrophosphohydrolase [Lentisphaera araneosa]EDM26117.1 hypothetical protein LNTAR_04686 [Lentisphaera araneosa HTCC2155]